jgi:hypothetical protein
MELIKKETDRRKKQRFPIQREMRYKMTDDGIVVASGNGQTIDMGSGGVAFASEGTLAPGAFVELSISWPVLLNESCPMRLIVFGRILRSGARKSVCTIDKYEFRTQAKNLHTMPAVRSDGMLQRWAGEARKGVLKTTVAQA